MPGNPYQYFPDLNKGIEENPYSQNDHAVLLTMLDKNELRGSKPDPKLVAEINRRNIALSDMSGVAVADLGMSVGDTALSKSARPAIKATGRNAVTKAIPKLSKVVSKYAPGLGTASNLVQGGLQVESGVNPYGRGKPGAGVMLADVLDGAPSYTGPFMPLAQAAFGGIVSDWANQSAADNERASLLKNPTEDALLNVRSRDWGRNMMSQMVTGSLNESENLHRQTWQNQYYAAPEAQRAKLRSEEGARRASYDRAQNLPWFVRSYYGVQNLGNNPGSNEEYELMQRFREAGKKYGSGENEPIATL